MVTFIQLPQDVLTKRLSDLIKQRGESFFDPQSRSGSMIRGQLNQFCADLVRDSFPDLDDSVYNRTLIVQELRFLALGGPGYKLKPRLESDYSERTFDGYLEGWLAWIGDEGVGQGLHSRGFSTIIPEAAGKLQDTLEKIHTSLNSTPDLTPASEKPGAP